MFFLSLYRKSASTNLLSGHKRILYLAMQNSIPHRTDLLMCHNFVRIFPTVLQTLNLHGAAPFWINLNSFTDFGQAALRDVNLLVEPPAVRRGQSVALRCDYQLVEAPLYSIKFYRGQMEFYRYTPGEYPPTKVFQFPGIRVDVSCCLFGVRLIVWRIGMGSVFSNFPTGERLECHHRAHPQR